MVQVLSHYRKWLDGALSNALNMATRSKTHNKVFGLSTEEGKARRTLISIMIKRVRRLIKANAKSVSHASVYRTQKAIGLYGHSHSLPGVNTSASGSVFPYHLHNFSNSDDVMFGRPCPVTPRHGFVESRNIASFSDLLALYKETVKEDPEAEIIVMPKYDGEFSAVAHNGGVAWALGHDGATAGKNVVFIPAPSPVSRWNSNTLGYTFDNALGIRNTAYLELVHYSDKSYGENGVVLVQRRDGPAQQAELDYIPEKVTVKKVINLFSKDGLDDLLKWEKYIKSLAGEKGVVFEHKGGTLGSHYAVHAIEHKIPVITSFIPHPGDVLTPSDSGLFPALSHADYKVIRKHLGFWTRETFVGPRDYSRNRELLATAIGTIHTMSRWDNAPHLIKLRAFAVHALLRYLHSAVAGELRHWTNNGPGRPTRDEDEGEVTYSPRGMRTKLKRDKNIGDGRFSIYAQYIRPMSNITRLRHLNTIFQDFGEDGWDPSYGGVKWQQVTLGAINLAKAIIAFMDNPVEALWTDIVLAANTALHTAHNNGLAVNKWIAGHTVDQIANAPGTGFLNSFAAKVVLGLEHNAKKRERASIVDRLKVA